MTTGCIRSTNFDQILFQLGTGIMRPGSQEGSKDEIRGVDNEKVQEFTVGLFNTGIEVIEELSSKEVIEFECPWEWSNNYFCMWERENAIHEISGHERLMSTI